MQVEWSDQRKWWMDLLKSALTFSVAAFVSLFLIDHLQAERIETKARKDAEYTARLKALEDFRIATVQYDAAAATAFASLFEWKTREKLPAMVRYEQDAYPRWVAATETVVHLFPKQAGKVKTHVDLANNRHVIYATLVNRRLDSEEYVEIKPWDVRYAFRELNRSVSVARCISVSGLQREVFLTSGSDRSAETTSESTNRTLEQSCETATPTRKG